MMLPRSRSWFAGLACTLLLAQSTLPVFAEAIWLPRLGYASTDIKRIYMEIDSDDKQEKTPEETDAAHGSVKIHKGSTPLGPTYTRLPDPEPAIGPVKPKTKDDELDAFRRQRHSERLARMRARIEENKAKDANAPVEGDVVLIDVKQGKVLFSEAERPKPLEGPESPKMPVNYYVDFKEPLAEGLYDLKIRGSGHGVESPLWINDSLYWDALQPVIQKVSKYHFPVENGKFRIVQQCYQLKVTPLTAASPAMPRASVSDGLLVDGGWFSESADNPALVKRTPYIAVLSQILMSLYNLNPAGYKSLILNGGTYAQSPYPDLLDEARWGLQYLATIQQPDGSIPAGILKPMEEGGTYRLAPGTPTDTAYGVMALATAAERFREPDLALSVKYVRQAQRAWDAMMKKPRLIDPEAALLAHAAMRQAQPDPKYAQAFEAALAKVSAGVSAETALLASDLGVIVPIRPVTESPSGTLDNMKPQLGATLPLLAQVRTETVQASQSDLVQLASDIRELYGYEKVPIVRDHNFQRVKGYLDPMQWMATKTGEVASRLGQKVTSAGLLAQERKLDEGTLKYLETQEKAARKRVTKGYEALDLNLPESIYLAYLLGVMNRDAIPEKAPEVPKKKFSDPDTTPSSQPKGFFPKLI